MFLSDTPDLYQMHNGITAKPFSFDDDDAFFFQHRCLEAEFETIANHAHAFQFTKSGGRYCIAAPSTKGAMWQLSSFDGMGAIGDTQFSSSAELAKELCSYHISQISVLWKDNFMREEVKSMQFENASYIAINGSEMTDGLSCIGDATPLLNARLALLQVGFVQKMGDVNNLSFMLSGQEYLTPAQLELMQQKTNESLKAGCDVEFKLMTGEVTCLTSENSANVAQITGYAVTHGHFANGDYGNKEVAINKSLDQSKVSAHSHTNRAAQAVERG